MNKTNPFEGNSKAKVIYNQYLKMASVFIGENASEEQKEVFAKEEVEKWIINTKKALKHSVKY